MAANTSSEHKKRLDGFIDVYMDTMGATSAPGVPENMRAGFPSPSGWFPWRPVESRVSENDVAALEHSIGATLPPLFVSYLTYKCLLMTDFGLLSLPETRSDRPLEEFQEYIGLLNREPYWRSHGYVPFGQDGDGDSILCFDTKRPDSAGDYPVMSVDPELVRQREYKGVQKWDSFADLLDSVQSHLRSFGK